MKRKCDENYVSWSNRRYHENYVSKLNHFEDHPVFERREKNFLMIEKFGRLFNLPKYNEFRLENCVLTVEFM